MLLTWFPMHHNTLYLDALSIVKYYLIFHTTNTLFSSLLTLLIMLLQVSFLRELFFQIGNHHGLPMRKCVWGDSGTFPVHSLMLATSYLLFEYAHLYLRITASSDYLLRTQLCSRRFLSNFFRDELQLPT